MITVTLLLTLMTSNGQSISQVKITGPENEVYETCEREGRSWSRDLLKNGKVIIAEYSCI